MAPVAAPVQQTPADRARLLEGQIKFAGAAVNLGVHDELQKRQQRETRSQTSQTAPPKRTSGVQMIDALKHPADPQDHMTDKRDDGGWRWPFRRRRRPPQKGHGQSSQHGQSPEHEPPDDASSQTEEIVL